MCCGQKRQMQIPSPPIRPRTAPSRPSDSRWPSPGTQTATASRSRSSLKDGEIAPGTTASQTPDSAPDGFVLMRYLQSAPIRARGLGSGRSYEFSGAHSVQSVDPRDVPGLLQTRLFRQGY